jgi:L-asparaginase II
VPLPMPALEIAARVRRGAGIEAIHCAAVAVVDDSSRLTHTLGDPSRVFFTRSAIKPLQALPLVTSEASRALALTEEELALSAASHSGTDRHREVVLGILKKCELGPEALKCGAHWPIGDRIAKKYPVHGEDRDPLRHNCSGKHAGFLALSRHLGQPAAAYIEPQGVVQCLVREAVAAACELEPDDLGVAVDGCSAPNFAMPLVQLAVGFKNLASSRVRDAASARALSEVRSAMQAHPVLVSGEGRFDYDLARAFPGNVVCKGGAEAILGIGFREPAIGIVIKVVDGAERALAPIAVKTLEQLGLIDQIASFPELARYQEPPVLNFRGLRTGEITADFSLRCST